MRKIALLWISKKSKLVMLQHFKTILITVTANKWLKYNRYGQKLQSIVIKGHSSDPSHEQEAHGPHHSPEKQFQPINTLAQSKEYAISLREKKNIISTLRIKWLIIHKKLSPFHTKIHCAKFG